MGSPGISVVKNLAANAGPKRMRVLSFVLEDPQRRNWHPLQYSYLGNPMDRVVWQAIVHGVTKESDTT